MIKLKILIEELLSERGMSMGYGSMSSGDTKLRPVPGGWNDDVPSWDGIIEGKDWFCYMEGNDWQTKKSGASVYINEDEKPYKMQIKIKTHGLRKNGDTNESYKEKVRKHTNKISRMWINTAKKIHDNPDINEVGNAIQKTWKDSFKEALGNPKLSLHISECDAANIDSVNFTYRK